MIYLLANYFSTFILSFNDFVPAYEENNIGFIYRLLLLFIWWENCLQLLAKYYDRVVDGYICKNLYSIYSIIPHFTFHSADEGRLLKIASGVHFNRKILSASAVVASKLRFANNLVKLIAILTKMRCFVKGDHTSLKVT